MRWSFVAYKVSPATTLVSYAFCFSISLHISVARGISLFFCTTLVASITSSCVTHIPDAVMPSGLIADQGPATFLMDTARLYCGTTIKRTKV